MQKRIWMIGVGIVTLTLIYIWSNSLLSIEQSSQQSGKVLDIVEVVFNTPPLDTDENQHVIRKIAHAVEFGLLGFEMVLLLILTYKMRWQNIMNIMFVGLAAATIDETLQIFSGRGSMVSDVDLDFGGLLIGVSVGYILSVLTQGIKKYISRKRLPKLSIACISKQSEK